MRSVHGTEMSRANTPWRGIWSSMGVKERLPHATTAQMEAAKAELGKPFPQEEELRVKSARLAELNAELNIDERTPMEQLADDAAISAKAERPSVLARLKNTPAHQAQDAHPQPYYLELHHAGLHAEIP